MATPSLGYDFNDLREYTRFVPSDDEGTSEEDKLLGRGGANVASPSTRHGPWHSNAWNSIFGRGHDLESARVNHQYTPEERSKLNNVESIDYLPPSSAMYRKWLSKQPHRRMWDKWVMMCFIGSTTGLVAHLLYMMISTLASFKYGVTRWLIAHTNMAWAWLFNVVVSTTLVAASSALAVGLAPEAIGSGVPDVMAYLNGCMLPKVFSAFTLCVKFLSCGLAVASGLPVGPEGPLIHIGAGIGSALSQGHSTTFGFSTKLFRRFRNPRDKRDFVTAGVSVGVATAFNAPIGGLLFAFEEVASFWQHSLGWQVFFACMCAVLVLNLSKSAGRAIMGRGHFGWFDNEVTFEVGGVATHILAVLPALVIGTAAGVLAIIFTFLNIKIARLRDALTSHLKWKRMIEPCVLTVLYVTGCMLLPLMFPCTPTECFTNDAGDMECPYSGLLLNPTGGAVDADCTGLSHQPALPLYTCRVVEHMMNGSTSGSGQWIPQSGGGSITPDTPDNSTKTVYYNQMATLLLYPGEEGIKHLFARGTHRRFTYSALLVMLVYYFLGALVFSGSPFASGLFVPMLMIGAVLGRLIGLATVDIAEMADRTWSLDATWTWIDPGAFALVGAGAFMGGVTRMTVALAVIMIEISSDVHMLLPVLVAIMMAKWVADAFTHSLYHGLLEVKCVPFLPPELSSRYSLDLLPVSFVMKSPVVTLQPIMKVRDITDAMRGTQHNGFPIVKDTPAGQVCIGLVTRSHVMSLLQRVMLAGHSEGLEVGWDELNRRTMDPVMAQRTLAEQQMVALTREMHDAGGLVAAGGSALRGNGSPAGAALGLDDCVVDLGPYINASSFMVPDSFSVERTYVLFRTMGLRHLIVVDDLNHCVGVVTRKDLMGFRLDDALERALELGSSASHHTSMVDGLRRRYTSQSPNASGRGSPMAVRV